MENLDDINRTTCCCLICYFEYENNPNDEGTCCNIIWRRVYSPIVCCKNIDCCRHEWVKISNYENELKRLPNPEFKNGNSFCCSPCYCLFQKKISIDVPSENKNVKIAEYVNSHHLNKQTIVKNYEWLGKISYMKGPMTQLMSDDDVIKHVAYEEGRREVIDFCQSIKPEEVLSL